MQVRSFALALVMLAGCGGADPGEGDPTTPPVRELPRPMLKMVAPTSISAGETMSIFGSGFADTGVGETRLTFEGIYQTTSGKVVQVKLDATPTFESQGVVTWDFGPNIPFSTEEETGTFRGILRGKNVGIDGKEKLAPQALGVEIQVLPSILIRQMRPVSSGCPVGITATTDSTKFYFELKAIGLKSGADKAPLRFIYTFLKQNFQFSGYLGSQQGFDPDSLFPKTGPVSVVDDVHNGTISSLGAGVPRDVNVIKGGVANPSSIVTGTDTLFGLTDLLTAPVNNVTSSADADYYDATMNVVAIDNAGLQAKRTIPLRVWVPIEVRYDGNSQPVRSYDPVPVSGCIPGGDIGRDVTYTETTSETRSRSFTFSAKLSGGFDIKVVKLNAEFGIEVDSSVSSSKSKDLQITATILPKQFGAFYRQTLQLERVGQLRGHGPCGTTQDLGQVVVTDWIWSPDLAKNKKCPPLPTSNLQPGKIFKQ